jgi:hypothetical protein
VYAVGCTYTSVGNLYEATVIHYNGTSWTEQMRRSTGLDGTSSCDLHGVWGSSPTRVFAVGGYGTVFHGTR